MKNKTITSLLVLVLCFSMACTTSWLSTFEGYLRIAGPILIQILEIASLAKGVPVNPALVAKIKADQVALNSLAASVDKATQGNLSTTCNAFNQAVTTFAEDLTAIEQLTNVGPNTSGEIGAVVGIAQAVVLEVEAPLSACASAPNQALARAVLQSAALRVKSPNDVLRRFNAVTDRKHHVHYHSLPVRLVTLGWLQ